MRPAALLIAVALATCARAPAGDGNGGAPADPALAQWRQDVLRGCIGGARDTVRDPSVPVERHCACAVDRIMAGRTLAQLQADEQSGAHDEIFSRTLRQCIHEISPDYRAGESG
jgi:hypothetical protein